MWIYRQWDIEAQTTPLSGRIRRRCSPPHSSETRLPRSTVGCQETCSHRVVRSIHSLQFCQLLIFTMLTVVVFGGWTLVCYCSLCYIQAHFKTPTCYHAKTPLAKGVASLLQCCAKEKLSRDNAHGYELTLSDRGHEVMKLIVTCLTSKLNRGNMLVLSEHCKQKRNDPSRIINMGFDLEKGRQLSLKQKECPHEDDL